MHRYSDEEKDFLKAETVGRSYKEITELFNQKFNYNLPVSSVMSTCFRYGFKNGLDFKFVEGYKPTQFKKGNVPFNKGTKGVMQANKTSFQKGSTPHNRRPVGSQRISVDGYLEVKTEEPKKWRGKHQLVWEAEHGPIPRGSVVIFADGNRTNIEIGNLVLVSRAELLVMNGRGLMSNDPDSTKTGVIIADIYLAVGKGKRRRKNKGG